MIAAKRIATSVRAALIAAVLAGGSIATAAEYNNEFTYQGALKASGAAVNGTANFEFRLYSVATLGVPLSAPLVFNNYPVTDGVFTVRLDFGALPQSKQERWLEIVVNSTILAPRQKLAPAPIAQVSRKVPLVFAGQIHESPYWDTMGNGAFASPNGITEALYTESRAQMLIPTACVAKNLFVRNSSNPSINYANTTATVRVNGIDSLLSCAQISTNGATCSNTVSTVAIAAGDLVSMKFTPNLPARPITNSELETTGFVSFGFICE